MFCKKRAIRTISHQSYLAHTEPLFLSLKLLKLKDIHSYVLACFLFNNDLQNRPEYARSHNYNTRNHCDLMPTYRRLTISQRSISYAGPMLWNSLPADVQNSRSLPVFKRKLKNYLLSKYLQI